MLFYLKLFYMILCIGSNIVIATHFRHNHGRITARAVSSIITKLPNDYRNSSTVAIFDAKNHRRSARSMPVSNENRNLSMYNLDKNGIIFLKTYLRFEAASNQDSGLKSFFNWHRKRLLSVTPASVTLRQFQNITYWYDYRVILRNLIRNFEICLIIWRFWVECGAIEMKSISNTAVRRWEIFVKCRKIRLLASPASCG